MGALFAKPKKTSRITDTDRSILTLKLQKDQLTIVRNKLTLQHDAADVSVRQYVACSEYIVSIRLLFDKKQSLALIALKHKKHQFQLLCQAEEYLLQVNQIISNVEMASVHNDVVKALAAGKCALASIQSEIDVDYVSKLLEDNAELTSQVDDVTSLLANVKVDDEELFEEYKSLEAQVALQRVAQEGVHSENEIARQVIQATPQDINESPISSVAVPSGVSNVAIPRVIPSDVPRQVIQARPREFEDPM